MTTHVHPHQHTAHDSEHSHEHVHATDQGGDHRHDHSASEAHLSDSLVQAQALAYNGPSHAFWTQYRPVLTSTDFIAAVLTGLLAIASWVVSLTTDADTVATILGLAATVVGGGRIAVGAIR